MSLDPFAPAEWADRLADELTRESIALQPNGCCGDGESRGALCAYHQGFIDGVELGVLRALGLPR